MTKLTELRMERLRAAIFETYSLKYDLTKTWLEVVKSWLVPRLIKAE